MSLDRKTISEKTPPEYIESIQKIIYTIQFFCMTKKESEEMLECIKNEYNKQNWD